MAWAFPRCLKFNILMSEPSFEVLDLPFGFDQDTGQSGLSVRVMIRPWKVFELHFQQRGPWPATYLSNEQKTAGVRRTNMACFPVQKRFRRIHD